MKLVMEHARAWRAASRPGLANVTSRDAQPARLNRRQLQRKASATSGGQEFAEIAPTQQLTGVVFQPFEEVAPVLAGVDRLLDASDAAGGRPTASLARSDYTDRLEGAVNEQINVELNVSYVYHAMASYFARDDVGLLGLAAYFSNSSDDERQHAVLLMDQQTRRGGRVNLQAILPPQSEYFHATKGDALYALELGLALEKLNFTKLRELHATASESGDAEMTQFIEDQLLREQSHDVKYAADLVSQVRRAGPGHGTFHLDVLLQRKFGYGLTRDQNGPLMDGDGA